MLWELVFMLVILKIPVVYLGAVVWWAIRAEPQPPEGAVRLAPLPAGPGCDWRPRRADGRRRGQVPRAGRPAVPARFALARARGAA
ncbi:MAG: hypothetical protein ACYC1P_07265 [Gaiellaceae bacterium]